MLRLAVQDLGRSRRESTVDHSERTPVRFVGPGRFATGVGQRLQFIADAYQAHRHRQFFFERGQLDEVVRKCGVRGASRRQPDDLTRDVRVAIAIAADPGPRPQDGLLEYVGIGPPRLQGRAHLGVDLRNHLEEGRRVVPQPRLDLVLNLQPRQPNQRRLPQSQNVAAQFELDAATIAGAILPMQAQPHQLGDAVLGVEHRPAARLGGVCGDHRRHQRTREGIGNRRGVQFGGLQLQIGRREAAVLRRFARRDVDGAAPLPVDVLGHVGEQREVGEGANDRDGPMNVDAVEQARQLGAVDLGAAHLERPDAGTLHEVEDFVAVLLAHRVAEDRTEQANVLAHRLGCLAANLGSAHGTDRCESGVGSIGHGFKYRRSGIGPQYEPRPRSPGKPLARRSPAVLG